LRTALIGLAFAASLCVPAAHAQRTQDESNIVVQGQKAVPPKQARQFVRQVMTSVEGQLARFADPVCPAVLGLPQPYATVLERRIRADAAEAGIETGREGKCEVNLLVIVAADADALVKQMRKEVSGLFGGLSTADLRRAMREGPVHVWNAVEVRNEDGAVAHTGGLEGSNAPTLKVRGASFVELQTQQAVYQSTIVIDADAMLGKSLNQVADYVAMRTLAGARPPQEGAAADTILTLFDPQAAAPPAMTHFDKSFLAGLYKARPMARSVSQASSISREIVRDSKARAGAN
jgi:hypothetical protein